MSETSKKAVLVVGAGYMGAGIAQVCAAVGYPVMLYDISPELIEKGLAQIRTQLNARIAKGKSTEEQRDEIVGHIIPTTDLCCAQTVEVVIEAIVENKEIKKDLFRRLDTICSPTAIFASNTSSIPISALACATQTPERFAGIHFFSPVPSMKLVEIIRGLKTSEQTCVRIKAFAESIGKTGVIVKDGPGFLVNRVNQAFKNEVFRCMEEGVATIEDIDTAIKLGLGHPQGPFELNDTTGLDIGLAVIEMLWENYRDPKWAPNLTLKKLVEAGELGKKSGKGWYDYTDGVKRVRTDLHF